MCVCVLLAWVCLLGVLSFGCVYGCLYSCMCLCVLPTLFLRAEIYHWTSAARDRFLGNMRWALLALNVALYAFLLIVAIVFITKPHVTTRNTCTGVVTSACLLLTCVLCDVWVCVRLCVCECVWCVV